MSKVSIYKPQPVVLPLESGLAREFYDKRSHLPGRPLLDETDYEGYETDTVFYDVFLDIQGQCLRALGPPLVNLAKTLLPLKTFVSTDDSPKTYQIKHRLKERDRIVFHTFSLPDDLLLTKVLSVKFCFANGYETTVYVFTKTLPLVYLQFTTLQKNNPIEWILDWMAYCQKLGVERLLLYDNGSHNFSELSTLLRAGPDDLDVILIPWPFNFGPVRSHYNKFCQAGQNNHASQYFGRAEWCGHFDLDEYPVVRQKKSLSEILRHQKKWIGLLRIDHYLLPNILDENKQSLPTARDFVYRNKALRKKGHKYIVRIRALKEAKTHNAYVKIGYFRRLMKPNVLVFFHYIGLTTNWKPLANRLKPDNFDPDQHKKDYAVVNVLHECDNT